MIAASSEGFPTEETRLKQHDSHMFTFESRHSEAAEFLCPRHARQSMNVMNMMILVLISAKTAQI